MNFVGTGFLYNQILIESFLELNIILIITELLFKR